MSNVFKKYQQFVKKPNRNTFDLSFTNNFTTHFGKLTPIFCKEVLPGDSVSINPTFGLNFAPMTYPVQTKMKTHLHFFYVRTRSLWKDWVDFIGNTKDDLIPPYIDFSANSHLLESCSLADYLGLPTTLVKPTGVTPFYSDFVKPNRPNEDSTSVVNRMVINTPTGIPSGLNLDNFGISEPSSAQIQSNLQYLLASYTFTQTPLAHKPQNFKASNIVEFIADLSEDTEIRLYGIVPFIGTADGFYYLPNELAGYFPDSPISFNYRKNNYSYVIDLGNEFSEFYENVLFGENPVNVKLVILYKTGVDVTGEFTGFSTQFTSGTSEYVQANELEYRPYDAGTLPISALPFRAYEAIYNSFYRNPQNNPFIKDGKPEYNTYVSNIDGGKDSTRYDLFQRNWEDDYLTTAVQSPQQGIAPLVGVSATGEFTFQDENGTYKAQASFADDGETITSINTENRMPAGTTRALIDLVSSGISINDFRNVNALQRWLEKNMRRGLRYKEQMMSHFGADVRFDELLMPEFIGGVSNEVDVNRIINTTANSSDSGAPLGSYAGLAQSFGGTNNKINHYADEHGFIIGILSVVPYANYSQLLPKMFTRNSVLDYYFPEFGNIGMQAITNRDIMPLQVYAKYTNSSVINAELVQTFGYQRPWWDYISTTDEVHGRFRTDFRDYLLNRVFANNPTLSPDFLTISPQDLNDVFSVEDDPETGKVADKILGIVHFDYKKKTTIPEFGIPKLEVQ